MCPQCRAFITSDDKICPYCDAPQGVRAIDRRMPDALLGGLIPGDRWVTMLLLMVNSALYVATLVVTMRQGNPSALMGIDSRTLIEFGANFPTYVSAGQWWRLITAGFLHINLFHVGMNMWALFQIGGQVEEVFGASRMTAIWVVSTFTGFAASYYFARSFSAGASAGLFGLIGAMIALGVLHKSSAFAQAAKEAYLRTAIYQLVIGFLGIFPMDNWAHMGGLAGGFVVALAAGVDRKDGGMLDRLWGGLAVVALGVVLYAFSRLILFSLAR
jgi:rhomboid protease GluP